jgi:hypothetical protein
MIVTRSRLDRLSHARRMDAEECITLAAEALHARGFSQTRVRVWRRDPALWVHTGPAAKGGRYATLDRAGMLGWLP